MHDYHYTAINSKGKTITGTLKANTPKAAQAQLCARKLVVTQLKLAPFCPQLPKISWPTFKRTPIIPLKRAALLTLTQGLATLITGGLSLVQSLETLCTQEKSFNTQALLEDLLQNIRSGQRFSQALAKHPKTFPALYRSLIQSAELGSALDIVLKELAHYLESSQRTRRKVQTALIYPCVVMGVAVLIVGLLMVFVVPKFQAIFADVLGNAALPKLTQTILNLSQSVATHSIPILLSLFTIILLLRCTPFINLKPFTDRLGLSLPLIKDIIRQSNTARFARTLSVLLKNGVPLLTALEMSTQTFSNIYFKTASTAAHQKVLTGLSFSEALAEHPVFSPTTIRMIQVGEETGELAPMLSKLTTAYESSLETTLSRSLALLEPTLIILLAISVGIIVIALFLPLIGIIEGLSL